MKFLTEDDLRVAYHDFPFETFTIQKNTRLTPGARTFLMDRKIQIMNETDENPKGKTAPRVETKVKKEQSRAPTAFDMAEWLAIRCELLAAAYDVATFDMVLAEELSLLEWCLAASGKEAENLLSPVLKIDKASEKMDKTAIVENLSTVGLYLHTNKGRVLTKLYPIYFRLDAFVEQFHLSENQKPQEVVDRLGQLIAYYLNKKEEVANEQTAIT